MKSVYFDSLATEYVKDIFAARGYTQLPLKEAQLLWTMSKDASFFTKLNQTQISNQLPGIMYMDRKDYLFQSLNQYTLQNNISPFYPKTFILNSEKNQFVEDDSFYIYKPAVNSRGNGIIISKAIPEETENGVFQKFIANPVLYSNKKFDLRVYSLFWSGKYYRHQKFLVRLCSEEFQTINEDNKKDNLKHLTNCFINHQKESGTEVLKELKIDQNEVFCQIDEILKHVFKACFGQIQKKQKQAKFTNSFQLLGIDIILNQNDNKIEANLLEVNTNPSVEATHEVDHEVKGKVINDLIDAIEDKGFGEWVEIGQIE
ncbi:Tubulin_tyrosine ligase-like 4 [Hexamita inflata]|uniref:Tubulin--tyrosine ligase-like protein 5 n=1 Tax=Hexamita inflata TaxID=28002 RepID=A0AA86QWI8_9EUKA|nr:Tubulin tyrosine ligase-like 4 [Hexamita inflata]